VALAVFRTHAFILGGILLERFYDAGRTPCGQVIACKIVVATVTGSVPVQTTTGQTKLQFRIVSEIDKAAVRRNAQRKIAETKMAKRAGVGGAPMTGPSYDAQPLGHMAADNHELAL
jgi:hypothetical protein